MDRRPATGVRRTVNGDRRTVSAKYKYEHDDEDDWFRTPNRETPKCSGFPTEFGELYKERKPLEGSRNSLKEQNK